MKRLVLFICTILCANVISAQLPIGSGFYYEDIMYEVTSENEVSVYHPRSYYYGGDCPSSIEIPSVAIYHMEIPGQGTFHEEYSVTSIRDSAFWGCSTLTSITIPNSVTSIGEDAFRNCSSLTSVTFEENSNLASIGDMAFNGCSSLTSIDIPNSVTSIRLGAFGDCSSLTSITIPESVTIIGAFLFEGCINLGTVNYNPINCSIDNSFWVGSPFLNSAINTINIGNSVQIIPDYFADSADSLTCVNFEDNSSVTSIGEQAFLDCSSLTSVTIPNSVTSIGGYAFSNCSSLTSITLGNSITSIQCGTFANCSSLTSITIPNSVTEIASPEEMFSSGAFEGCSSLTSVTFGESLAEIGERAFATSSFLQNITCLGTNPPILYNNSFPYPNIATVTVPCGSLEAYSAPTSYWNTLFTDRIEENGYNVEVSVNDETFGSVAVESDCSTATLTATASEGYVFLSWNDENTDNPRTVALTSDTSFTAIFALIDNSSLSEDAEFAELSVYPNPTRGKVMFNQAIEKIEVIDLSGKTLQTYENANEINIEALPAGVYHLRLTIEDKTTTRKVIKE